MNRLWLSIRGFFRKNRENEKGSFCFRGYSSEFSVSEYLRRMSELSARLVKERIEIPKPKLTFEPFASDSSIEIPQNTMVTPKTTVGLLPEANMTSTMRDEWIRMEIEGCCCVQAQHFENEKYQTACSSEITRLREEIAGLRIANSQSAQNEILRGILQQNQRIATSFDSINLPIITAMLGVQASDCLRKPCETPYSNIPRRLFG